jgi:hypothetical protein
MGSRLARDGAEAIAFRALAYIAEDDGRLGRFVAETGIVPHRLAEAAREPAFAGAVMSWLMGDEAMLLAFAEAHGLAPETVAEAARVLAPPAGDFDG